MIISFEFLNFSYLIFFWKISHFIHYSCNVLYASRVSNCHSCFLRHACWIAKRYLVSCESHIPINSPTFSPSASTFFYAVLSIKITASVLEMMNNGTQRLVSLLIRTIETLLNLRTQRSHSLYNTHETELKIWRTELLESVAAAAPPLKAASQLNSELMCNIWMLLLFLFLPSSFYAMELKMMTQEMEGG